VSIYLKQVTDLISTLDGSTDEGDQPIDADAAHTALDPLLSQFDRGRPGTHPAVPGQIEEQWCSEARCR
jgi:hypothetical protein